MMMTYDCRFDEATGGIESSGGEDADGDPASHGSSVSLFSFTKHVNMNQTSC